MSKRQLTKKNKPIHLYIMAALVIGTSLFLLQTQNKQQTISKAESNCTVSSSDLTINSQEKTMFDAINAYRSQNGLQPYVWNAGLKKPTKWFSNDMSAKNYLDHTDSLGRDLTKRLKDCGFVNFTLSGENVADKSSDPITTLNAFKASPPHNANLLSTKFTQIGIANSGNYWTQNFTDSTSSLPAPTVPNAVVPSATCLGSCPSMAPTDAQDTGLPSETSPTDSLFSPTEIPFNSDPNTDSLVPSIALESLPSPANSATQNGGLLAMIIQFFLLFLQLLLGK